MTRAMYMSKLYAPTLKEDPADARPNELGGFGCRL